MSANKKRKPRGKSVVDDKLVDKEAYEKRLLYQREYQRRRYHERKNKIAIEKEIHLNKLIKARSDESILKEEMKRIQRKSEMNILKQNETRLQRLERLERRAMNINKRNRPYREKLSRLIQQERELIALTKQSMKDVGVVMTSNVEDNNNNNHNDDSVPDQPPITSPAKQSEMMESESTKVDDINVQNEDLELDHQPSIKVSESTVSDINNNNDDDDKSSQHECANVFTNINQNTFPNSYDLIELEDSDTEIEDNESFEDNSHCFLDNSVEQQQLLNRQIALVLQQQQKCNNNSKIKIDVIDLDSDSEMTTTTTDDNQPETRHNNIELIEIDSDTDDDEDNDHNNNNNKLTQRLNSCSRVSVISFASNDSGFSDYNFKDEDEQRCLEISSLSSSDPAISNQQSQQQQRTPPCWTKKMWLLKHKIDCEPQKNND